MCDIKCESCLAPSYSPCVVLVTPVVKKIKSVCIRVKAQDICYDCAQQKQTDEQCCTQWQTVLSTRVMWPQHIIMMLNLFDRGPESSQCSCLYLDDQQLDRKLVRPWFVIVYLFICRKWPTVVILRQTGLLAYTAFSISIPYLFVTAFCQILFLSSFLLLMLCFVEMNIRCFSRHSSRI